MPPAGITVSTVRMQTFAPLHFILPTRMAYLTPYNRQLRVHFTG
jgi:hypothetical protein